MWSLLFPPWWQEFKVPSVTCQMGRMALEWRSGYFLDLERQEPTPLRMDRMSCLGKKPQKAPALFMPWRTRPTPPCAEQASQLYKVTVYRVECYLPGWQSGMLTGAMHRSLQRSGGLIMGCQSIKFRKRGGHLERRASQ